MAAVTFNPRAIAWERPAGLAYPAVINTALANLSKALVDQKGPLWKAFRADMPVFRTAKNDERLGPGRKRSLRQDGAKNLHAVLSAIVGSTDIGSYLIATPSSAGPWTKLSWDDIHYRAFGVAKVKHEAGGTHWVDKRGRLGPGDQSVSGMVSFRRTERLARALESMGLIEIHQMKPEDIGNGEYRTRRPAIKRVTDQLWKMVGVYKAIMAARRARDRVTKRAKIHDLMKQKSQRPTVQKAPPGSASPVTKLEQPAQQHGPPRPPATGEPSQVAIESIAFLKKHFNQR